MTSTPEDVVARLRALAQKWGAAEGPQEGRLGIADEAADLISALTAQVEGLTRETNKYAWERDKAREERDQAEARSEAFWKPQLTTAEAKVAELTERVDELEESLHRIRQWSDAYPLDIFPEPDFVKARALLEAGGMTLDAISASNMRHVVEGVGNIARNALTRQHP